MMQLPGTHTSDALVFDWLSLSGPSHSIGGESLLKKSHNRGSNVECALWFSVSLFYPSRYVAKKQKKHCLQRWWTQKKANSAIVRQSERCLQEKDTEKVCQNVVGEAMTPNNAPTEASTHLKPPWYSFHLKSWKQLWHRLQSDSEELC